ncbi:hypothetical protein [Anaerovirgula multivorans]|uniref:hypothetical protein n=1 Tax=Anaerovirgula multivorans TaxID=312168 RepID=UPI001595B793|nr:hypothetical protein [Anaerovirgula multivorans]
MKRILDFKNIRDSIILRDLYKTFLVFALFLLLIVALFDKKQLNRKLPKKINNTGVFQ